MTYRKKTTIVAVVCIALAAVVAGAAINYANDDEFKDYVDGFTTTDADGDSYWDNLMPWDSGSSSDTTAPSSGNNTPTGTTAGSQISTGEFISGKNLTLYGSYLETDIGLRFGFVANGLAPNTKYRVRIVYKVGDLFDVLVMNNEGDGDWHEYAYSAGGSNLTGCAVYDPDTREVSVDFVLRTNDSGTVEIMLEAPQWSSDDNSVIGAHADSFVAGVSASFTKTSSPISTCICHPDAVG